ncbi:MAG: Uma2 family endonuclease [Pirellulaceae bacterium]
MATHQHATIEDLYREEGKAELVGGEIVRMSPAGDEHNCAAGNIYVSLWHYQQTSGGRSYTDNTAFRCDLPNRQSFSPDAAYYTGPRGGKKFLPQAPDFAVEVRSEEDYGPKAEQRLAEKRADYFAAGTKVVWDVALESEDIVRVYRSADPDNPTIHRRGEVAEAEPAVPGWTMPVDELFR